MENPLIFMTIVFQASAILTRLSPFIFMMIAIIIDDSRLYH